VDLLDRLTEDPAHTGLFLDVDGVLAPIVPRPEDARVPEETRVELRRLAARYALVACISGRAGDTAAEIVSVPELTYVGNHGLELEPEADD
jgi:trehalose 6-phosphate phosphatase